MPQPRGRDDLLVVGVGHPLRGDDRVGLVVVERLQQFFGGELNAIAAYEIDPTLVERLAQVEELLVIDALAEAGPTAFELRTLHPAASSLPPAGGFISHLFDWGVLLALARDMFGRWPRTTLVGIPGTDFSISEDLSPGCRERAEQAFDFLVRYCSQDPDRASRSIRR